MPTSTTNLKLYKYNTTTDAKEVFSINTALNNNWDKIDQGVGTINTNITNLSNTILALDTEISQIDLSKKVNKSGDTMTGNLVIETESPVLVYKDTRYTFTQASSLSESMNNYLPFRDSTGETMGYIQSHLEATQSRMCFGVRKLGDITTSLSALPKLGICANSSTVWTTCPESDKLNSIVTTTGITKAKNGYVKHGNGILTQWGYRTGWGTVTFPTAFNNTNYSVVITPQHDGCHNCYENFSVQNMTKTTFEGYEYTEKATGFYWMAIGY